MDVPKSRVVITGDEGPPYRTMDEFFVSIKSELEDKLPKGPDYFRIECRHLIEGLNTTLDDTMHMLYYRDSVIAVVTETRTELNYVRFDFFRNLENLTLKNP